MITTSGVDEQFLHRNSDDLYSCRCNGEHFIPCDDNGAPAPFWRRGAHTPGKILMRCAACGIVVDHAQHDTDTNQVPVIGQVVADQEDLTIRVRWTETATYERTLTLGELRAVLDAEYLPRWAWMTAEGCVRTTELPGWGEMASAAAGFDHERALLRIEDRDIDEVMVVHAAPAARQKGAQ